VSVFFKPHQNIIYLLEQDEATAMKYYNLACEKGLGAACYNIADFAIENGDLAKAKGKGTGSNLDN
jgi:TPR repeat protein